VRVHDDDALALSASCSMNWSRITLDHGLRPSRPRKPARRTGEVPGRCRQGVALPSSPSMVATGLGCAAVAYSMGIPVGCRYRSTDGTSGCKRQAASRPRIWPTWYSSDERASRALANEGVPAAHIRQSLRGGCSTALERTTDDAPARFIGWSFRFRARMAGMRSS
jgi:hypothetical protein